MSRAFRSTDAVDRLRADVPVLHLQWLIAERNQMKQAWYRCRELLDGAQAGCRDQ